MLAQEKAQGHTLNWAPPGALFADAPPVEPTPERARVIARLMGRISRLSVEELGKVERAVRIVLE